MNNVSNSNMQSISQCNFYELLSPLMAYNERRIQPTVGNDEIEFYFRRYDGMEHRKLMQVKADLHQFLTAFLSEAVVENNSIVAFEIDILLNKIDDKLLGLDILSQNKLFKTDLIVCLKYFNAIQLERMITLLEEHDTPFYFNHLKPILIPILRKRLEMLTSSYIENSTSSLQQTNDIESMDVETTMNRNTPHSIYNSIASLIVYQNRRNIIDVSEEQIISYCTWNNMDSRTLHNMKSVLAHLLQECVKLPLFQRDNVDLINEITLFLQKMHQKSSNFNIVLDNRNFKKELLQLLLRFNHSQLKYIDQLLGRAELQPIFEPLKLILLPMVRKMINRSSSYTQNNVSSSLLQQTQYASTSQLPSTSSNNASVPMRFNVEFTNQKYKANMLPKLYKLFKRLYQEQVASFKVEANMMNAVKIWNLFVRKKEQDKTNVDIMNDYILLLLSGVKNDKYDIEACLTARDINHIVQFIEDYDYKDDAVVQLFLYALKVKQSNLPQSVLDESPSNNTMVNNDEQMFRENTQENTVSFSNVTLTEQEILDNRKILATFLQNYRVMNFNGKEKVSLYAYLIEGSDQDNLLKFVKGFYSILVSIIEQQSNSAEIKNGIIQHLEISTALKDTLIIQLLLKHLRNQTTYESNQTTHDGSMNPTIETLMSLSMFKDNSRLYERLTQCTQNGNRVEERVSALLDVILEELDKDHLSKEKKLNEIYWAFISQFELFKQLEIRFFLSRVLSYLNRRSVKEHMFFYIIDMLSNNNVCDESRKQLILEQVQQIELEGNMQEYISLLVHVFLFTLDDMGQHQFVTLLNGSQSSYTNDGYWQMFRSLCNNLLNHSSM